MLEVREYQGGFRDRVDGLMVRVERIADAAVNSVVWRGGGRGIVGVMSVELIRASGLTDAVPYAYASVVPAGARLVHTAGACPIDEHDRVVALGDVAGQARQVMDNLEVALQPVLGYRGQLVEVDAIAVMR